MSGHLVEEALKLGAIMVHNGEGQGGAIKRDWDITFDLEGFTIKHGVNCTLEEMYAWVLELQGVFNINAPTVTAAPVHSNIDGSVKENSNDQARVNMNSNKYPNRNDVDKIVSGLICPFNGEKELAPSREDWARYNDQDGMLDNYYCTKDQDANGESIDPPNCTRGAECGKTIWRRQAHTSITV